MAAVNWLAATQGDGARLSKTSVRHRPLNLAAISALQQLNHQGFTLAIGDTHRTSPIGVHYFVRAEAGQRPRYFHIDAGGLAEVPPARAWITWIRRQLDSPFSPVCLVEQRVALHPALRQALTSDAWLRPQLAMPHYEPHPPCRSEHSTTHSNANAGAPLTWDCSGIPSADQPHLAAALQALAIGQITPGGADRADPRLDPGYRLTLRRSPASRTVCSTRNGAHAQMLARPRRPFDTASAPHVES
ncbi:hypothetical protein ACI2UK_13560 [Ralstonia nicotianae]|uniref:hypothetical protein n=1 Tax=Ralstonia pseudosolanacearum TaxID=1310165 RepID=UPI00200336CA|nr:hypothetical protein [Ralstonia pseudosolanacearum]MCK4118428.1 hypothetical protein [Ralstonia pseudosolanacearum]